MHLGLTDRPSVPHTLISVQQSLVPLSNLQNTHKLKILMSSDSKKGTTLLSLKKSQVPQLGPYGDSRLLDIFTYPLIYLLISKALRKERTFMFPKSMTPMKTDIHIEPYLTYLLGSQIPQLSPYGDSHL
jgi:hypothetical protein